MAWKGLYMMLLLVLLATWLALARAETRFEKFQRQHVAPQRTGDQDTRAYCNQMMQRQGMTSPVCKWTNTFIHVNDVTPITDVCGPGGTPAVRNLRDSNAPFNLTICQLQGTSWKQPCNYDGNTSNQRIRIACGEGLPVHYEHK